MSHHLALGDPKLDSDHGELDRLIEQLAAAPPERAVETLRALQRHATEHFNMEDQDLHDMKDGNATCHIDEHAAVLKSLEEVCVHVAPDPASARSRDMLVRLVAELRRWLPVHVLEMDAAVASSRTRKRLGGAPIVLNLRGSRG
jgi:hemerythrin-like metal-binding protein